MPSASRPAAAALAVLALGLLVRFSPWVPAPIRDPAGGVAYTLLVAILLHTAGCRAAGAAGGAFLFSATVEALQAWHAPWLDAVRATLPGRLVLGTTFDAHDFLAYAFGAALAWGALRYARRCT